MTNSPAVWQAIGIRALIGLAVILVMTIATAAYVAGARSERRRMMYRR